jgi:Protein of unknown function (DUF2934)
MSDSRSSTPPKPKILTVPKQALSHVAPPSDARGRENKIRERAHQLFESRGREHGQDKQDWTQAEHEILNPRS